MTGYRQFPTRFGENRVLPSAPAKAAKPAKDRGGNFSTLAALAGVDPQTRNFTDDTAWWRDLFEERAAIRQFDGGYSRAEAERLAWEDLEYCRHRFSGERIAPDLCAGCLQPVDPAPALTLDDGCRVHLACVARYGRRWREAASAALAALGLTRPPSPDRT
jgi:hypothetical protein